METFGLGLLTTNPESCRRKPRIDTNAHEYRRVNQICRERAGITVWWLVRVRHNEIRSIRVDSCSFVVQLNYSG
jgi:hypothetical protein